MTEIVERLRERAACLSDAERPLSDATIAADELERLQAWSQKQADDIMTLGQEIGRLKKEAADWEAKAKTYRSRWIRWS